MFDRRTTSHDPELYIGLDEAAERAGVDKNEIRRLAPILGFKTSDDNGRVRYDRARFDAVLHSIRKPRFVFRSAETGQFVSEEYADANPDTTVRERL
jgi:hypothetical protein